jgi:hypothetical protein
MVAVALAFLMIEIVTLLLQIAFGEWTFHLASIAQIVSALLTIAILNIPGPTFTTSTRH